MKRIVLAALLLLSVPASAQILGAGTSGATGTAGGDLTGTYPSPTVNTFNSGTAFGAAAGAGVGANVGVDGSSNLYVAPGDNVTPGVVRGDGTTIDCVAGVCTAATGSGNANFGTATGNTAGYCVEMADTTVGVEQSTGPCAVASSAIAVTGATAITAAQFNAQAHVLIKATATITLPQSNGSPSLNNGLVPFLNTGNYVPTFAINAGDCVMASGDAACRTTGASYVGTAGYSYLISSDGAGKIFIHALASSGGSGVTVGSTTITGGTDTRSLYDNAGVVGERAVTGTGNAVLATSPTLVTPALGTPASGVATNLTGTAAGLTAGNVTTNANLTGPITSSGNATAIASQTGTGTKFVVDTSPTLVTPVLGVATATSVNKVAITAPAASATITVADGKTLTASNSLTLAGTDSTTMTFPSTSATVARTDAANTFTGVQTFNTAVAVGSGGTGLSTGTSGGVPYYSGSTTLASSAALTANLPVIGGGAGAAPAVGTRSGNTTQFVTTTGAQTSGDCVKIDANGNHVANGSVCGSGGSGGGMFNYSDNGVTLTAGTYYAPIGGGGIPQSTEANVSVKSPSATTVSNLQVSLSADPGSGQTLAVTLRKGGSDQSVTCTITGSGGGTATTCQDLTHSFNVAQNDVIDWKVVTTGTYVATPTLTITAANGTSGVGVTTLTAGTNVTLSSGATCTASCTVNSNTVERTAISGRFYWARRFTAAAGTTVGTGTVKWMPFTNNQPLTIDQIGFRATTGVGASTCDLFLFSNNTSGMPGTELGYATGISTASSGTVASSYFSDVADVTLTAGVYWFGVTCSASGVIFESSATSNSNNGYIAGAGSASDLASGTTAATVSYSSTLTYGGVPTTNPTMLTEASNAAQAEIFFHVE